MNGCRPLGASALRARAFGITLTLEMGGIPARVLVRCALVIVMLAAATAAAAHPFNPAALAGAPICNPDQTAFADIDKNGVVDRVESHESESAAAEIVLTLNDTRQVHLAEPIRTCDLVLIDFDDDTDIDLVAFTAGGQLLVWRNDGGVLGLIHSQPPPSRFPREWEPGIGKAPGALIGLRECSVRCAVPSAPAGVRLWTGVVPLPAIPAAYFRSNPCSAPRAPPTC